MRYFLDTEFIEYPNTIELISIGIVSENGSSLYAESCMWDIRKASEWVKENVVPNLKFYNSSHTVPYFESGIGIDHELREHRCFGNINLIKSAILLLIDNDKRPEFWTYYGAYDWVAFAWIFGTMMELPKNFPYGPSDLRQLMDEMAVGDKWLQENCPEPVNQHNALADAQWNKNLYEKLMKL